jgi:phosphoribosyl 1,2-cyclic phosphodiesterase
MSYSLKLLYSGSDGNAALLCAGGHAVLIDAGRSAKCLCAALCQAGVDPDRLDAILITHEHRDHTAALDVFVKHHPVPVHMTERSAQKMLPRMGDALRAQLVLHPPLYTVEAGPITLSSFPTSHDSVQSVGFRITVREGDEVHTIGYATDLGTVTPAVEEGLCGCEEVVLECNHDEEMLMEGPYPYDLKRRIASPKGHLSNRDCAAFSTRLATNGLKRLLLAHLSEINNLPLLALGEVRAALAGTGVEVRAAAPDHITEL